MSTLSYAVSDSTTMLRRSIRRIVRYPSMTLLLVGMPIVFLLLFVYVFGGTLGAGLGGARADYLTYVVPGILLMAIASACQGTAISVAMDMTEGIVARFRTMAISRASVLTGHVLGNIAQSVVSLAIVLGVAILLGFRPAASPLGWLAATGMAVLVILALTWLCVALGLVTKSVETASNLPMPLTFLPFLGSGFVPTTSMPAGLRWFAQYQPFTPIIETFRGLLMGTAVGGTALIAITWCAVIGLAGYLWAKKLYNRDPSPR
ncbi:ABC transporter permease [Fodinicola feengrottensis]|uniref:Transport permease protein n=1 Tax=Fodinicola feengrottensis TaxID=435914 RepID=A0ABP4UPW7_9ACTN